MVKETSRRHSRLDAPDALAAEILKARQRPINALERLGQLFGQGSGGDVEPVGGEQIGPAEGRQAGADLLHLFDERHERPPEGVERTAWRDRGIEG